jgi:hypothetical protein
LGRSGRANRHELKIISEIWIKNIQIAKEGFIREWEKKLRLTEVILRRAAVTIRPWPAGSPAMRLG